MRFGPLKFLSRMHAPDGRRTGMLIASLHWRNSLTWRWALNWRTANKLIPYGFGSARTYKSAPGWNGSLTLNLPVFGYLHLVVQPNKFKADWKAYT
ncbi:hypothetical protein AL064_18845 [Pseudomonas syringae pv. syringae]|uniref:hypothetical protein n=1 Tax=Pseudomonas syringae TaxID=317 RepID=UPI0007607DF2|nr:hypothetical protein [Pseudomonas syringae]KWS07472.1 hypothetical protein AL064_18845 [Pseudomonas syringae pv. syringae]